MYYGNDFLDEGFFSWNGGLDGGIIVVNVVFVRHLDST